ncbi:zinc finger domain-containing protein, partial [Eschrichtius robustus]|nr:zinc finger domain-containing protein [Eschrichtius robustus]
MDQCSLGDKGTLPSEMHLPSFPESQALKCSDTLNRDLGPGSRDLLYDGLSRLDLDPSLPMPDAPSEMLEDNLDALSLYSGKDGDSVKLLEERADPESQTSLRETKDILGIAGAGPGLATVIKVLNLDHRNYLEMLLRTGHMLTHQKTKPFVCIEQGCSKSYCDYRSLRRHYEVQHGLCILKEAPPEEEASGSSPHAHEVASQPAPASLWPLAPPEAPSPSSLLPSRDLLRCIVSSIVHQKVPSPGPAPGGPSDSREGRNTACSCLPASGSSFCGPASTPAAPGALGTEVPEEPRPPQKEPATDVSTAVHSRAAEDSGPDPAEPEPPLLQPPSSLEGWPEGAPLPPCLPLFRGQTVPASSQPSSHSFQWLRNLSGCPKSKGNSMFVVHKPSAVPSQEGSEPGPGLSSDSPAGEPSPSRGTGLEDTPPFPPTLLKAPGEASGDPSYASTSGEDDSWASKMSKFDCDSFSWQNPGEPGPQDGPKSSGLPSDATPLLRQLFLKSQESLVSHEQMQVFQMITKSQRIFSHTQVAAASSQLPTPDSKQVALKSLQGLWPQQPPPMAPTVDSLHAGPVNPEPEGSLARRRKSTPAFPTEASPGSVSQDTKGRAKVAAAPPALTASSLDPPRNPDISSLPKQLRSSKGTLDLGNIFSPGGLRQTQLGGEEPSRAHLPGKQAQAEDGTASGATKGEKGPACSRGGGYRLFSGNSRAQRFSGFRKAKVKMDMRCAASPSQVAMASFSSSAGPPADPPWDSKSKLTIFNRIQVFGMEFCKPPGQVLRPEGDRQSPPGARKPLDNMTAAPLVVPVSVPVAAAKHPPGSKGQGKDGEERDSKESSQHRKRKKLPRPKAPLIPPPPSTSGEPGPGGCRQSWLRSPVLLVDRLLKGLSWCPPYTPPPMLSPIREGSGLYFNTLCPTSAQARPDRLVSAMLGE